MQPTTYQISRAGQIIGTYDLEALQAAVQSGQVLPTDFAWAPGMPAWKAVSTIVAVAPMPPGPDSAVSGGRVRAVAENQRGMIFGLLFSFVIGLVFCGFSGIVGLAARDAGGQQMATLAIGILYWALAVAFFVFWCVKVYKLADALQAGPAALWVVAMFAPCFNYIFVLILSQKATNFLQANGVKVGFFGADPSKLP
jgi:hypothetical protein